MHLIAHIQNIGGTAKPDCPELHRIALAAECSPSTLYMIVRGHKQPSGKLARRLSIATGVSVHDLRPDVFGPAANDS